MAYNPDLDRTVEEIGVTETGIAVSVRQYDEGPRKVSLDRVGKNGRSWKLGRMTAEDLAQVIPLLQEAEIAVTD